MVPELQKPRITEIHVRMDCQGCVQKIKKALHGITGIYDVSIDYPKQRLTVIGWADPEKIVKAIKKTKKIATICSHIESTDSPSQPTEPAPEAAPDATPPPPTEAPPAEATPPEEPPKDPPPPENPSPPENPPPESSPPPPPAENPSEPKDVEEIHVIHHHHSQDHGYGYGGFWNNHPNDHGQWKNYHNDHKSQSSRPVYATHSYNTYKPSPYVSEYYQYDEPPPRPTYYSRMEHQSGDYRSNDGNGNGNITSMFSDENPNACRIV